MTGNRDRVALTCFVASALLAGGNGVSIRFSNRELAPLWGAGLRFSLAAALLLVIMPVRRLGFPRGRALTGALLYGALNFGAAFALAYYALVRLHAGLGQTLLALVPLATLLLAVAQRQERLRLGAVIGTLLALAGVAVISQGPLGASVPLDSLLAALASAVCIAQAAVLVLRYWAASRAAYGFVVIPFVTVILLAWLDDEPLGAGLLLGGLLVLAGVYVGALRPTRPPPTPVEVDSAP